MAAASFTSHSDGWEPPCATLLAMMAFAAELRSLTRRLSAGMLLAAAWLPGNTAHAADTHPPSITFRFEPTMVKDRNAFHVIEIFRARQPETEIVVPAHWGGAEHLEDQTQNLKVDSPAATLTSKPADPSQKLLHARPGERIELSYDIVPQQTEWFHHPQEHMAVINEDYFLFNPQNALVYPGMPHTGEIDVTFDWSALPRNIPIVTSFGILRGGEKQRVIRARAPWIQIADCLLAGGNFRISEDNANGTTVVLAARGIWKFSDAEALKDVRRIIDEENRFWHAAPMSYFLVTLAPFDDRSGDNDGSGFTNAYMLFLSHEDTMDAERLQLMAHEMFHHWNPKGMGARGADDVAQWFAEGFTVYYAGVIPLRSGLTDYSGYLNYLNTWLRRYELSPLRGMKEDAWRKLSHASGEGYALSYERGAAIALWADAAIRARSNGSHSLDNVMFDLVHQSETANPAPEFTEERVLAAFSSYLSADQMQLLRSMAIDGADVPLPEKLGGCAVRRSEMVAVVDPGFDQAASYAAKRMTGVVEDGPAYRAGVRNGQELFRWSVYTDDPSKDALLGVVIDGQRKTVTFSPAKQEQLEQYRASGEATDHCTPF
jgi:predicted metalloprotease with PDZ domain